MDIVKAIEKEQEYLFYRRNGDEPFHLVDAIKECGFDTLEEYFAAKKEYGFNHLSFAYIEKTPADYAKKYNFIGGFCRFKISLRIT